MTTRRFPLAELTPADDRRVRSLWGRPPLNLYRILAHHPRILRAWTEWNNELRHGCTLPRALRELIFLRSATLQDSAYEWTQHVAMARRAGVDDARIEAIAHWRDATVFDELERTVLAATDAITGGALGDDDFARLKALLPAADALEVIVTASHAAMLGRVIQAIGVTDEGEMPAHAANQGGHDASGHA